MLNERESLAVYIARMQSTLQGCRSLSMLLSKTPAEYSTKEGKGQWPQQNISKEVLADCSARNLDTEMIERPMRSFASASDLLAKRDGHYTGTSRQSKKVLYILTST